MNKPIETCRSSDRFVAALALFLSALLMVALGVHLFHAASACVEKPALKEGISR